MPGLISPLNGNKVTWLSTILTVTLVSGQATISQPGVQMEISEFGQRRSNSFRIYTLSISYGYQQKSL